MYLNKKILRLIKYKEGTIRCSNVDVDLFVEEKNDFGIKILKKKQICSHVRTCRLSLRFDKSFYCLC